MHLIAGSGDRSTMNVHCGISKTKPKTGVTMTDFSYYAGLAMQAIVSTKHLSGNWDNEDLAEIAKFSYAMALAMLEQKNELADGGVI